MINKNIILYHENISENLICYNLILNFFIGLASISTVALFISSVKATRSCYFSHIFLSYEENQLSIVILDPSNFKKIPKVILKVIFMLFNSHKVFLWMVQRLWSDELVQLEAITQFKKLLSILEWIQFSYLICCVRLITYVTMPKYLKA